MGIQDKVSLSVRERQQLARLQLTLESADPRLAKLLRGKASGKPSRGQGPWSIFAHVAGAVAARWWTGPLCLVAGLALVVGTIPWLVWLSIPGAVVTAVGLGLVFHTLHPYLAAKMAELATRTANAGTGAAPRSPQERGDDWRGSEDSGL